MNIVITVNLNGNAFQLEKNGYDTLREYLENAARQLEGNPDKAEIIADIEQSMADKFRTRLNAFKTVVVASEVDAVIAEMGPVQSAEGGARSEGAPAAAATPSSTGADAGSAGEAPKAGGVKRLYRINEGAMVSGVCNGLGAYFNIDVTIIRLLFVVLTLFTWGGGLLLYFVMSLVVPAAESPQEKAAAFGGGPSTAEDFVRRAKAGYYEGMRTFRDRDAHREWKRRFRYEMRGWSRDFKREMRANAFQWRQNWQAHWGQPNAWWFALPLIGFLKTIVTLGGLLAVALLVANGSVFGMTLPAGIPLWVGVLALLIAINLVVWPLRAMKHAIYFSGGYGGPYRVYGGPAIFGPVAGMALVVLVLWTADHHWPAVHAALLDIREHLRHGIDAVRTWWNSH
ncbi:MAG TPA: PspC domain-containing protein [Candidatus Didemnitutus sp.]|nr:PspC domain-containing protein [Candidatus Didemnitutus sp.]